MHAILTQKTGRTVRRIISLKVYISKIKRFFLKKKTETKLQQSILIKCS